MSDNIKINCTMEADDELEIRKSHQPGQFFVVIKEKDIKSTVRISESNAHAIAEYLKGQHGRVPICKCKRIEEAKADVDRLIRDDVNLHCKIDMARKRLAEIEAE